MCEMLRPDELMLMPTAEYIRCCSGEMPVPPMKLALDSVSESLLRAKYKLYKINKLAEAVRRETHTIYQLSYAALAN